MIRNKFQEQMQNRRIAPSSNSWKRLDEQLTARERKQKNKRWAYYTKYAAAVLIIISVSYKFYQVKNENEQDEIIIANPTSKKQPEKSFKFNSNPDIITATPIENPPIVQPKEHKTNVQKLINYEVQEKISFQNNKTSEENFMPEKYEYENLRTEKTENADVVVHHQEVTDNEIEELLQNANINLVKNGKNINKNEISANDLLGEVEYELQHEYKRKLFEKVIISLNRPKEIELTNRSK